MPNWCSTEIIIYCDNNEEIENLYNKIKEWTSKDYEPNGFGLNWLGNIVGNSEIGTIDTGTETDLSCRGYLAYLDYSSGELRISTDTAWRPMLGMWDKLADKYLTNPHIIYEAEEAGCELFHTNNDDLAGTYWSYNDGLEDFPDEYSISPSELKTALQKLLESNENDLDKLLNLFHESDFSDDIFIQKWEYVPLSEYCD